MLQVKYYPFELPFQYPFSISKGTKTHQPSLVVSIGLRHWVGFGEAPAISYYNTSVAAMIAEIEAKKLPIERFALTEPERFWHFIEHLFPNQNFLIAAFDIAGWDFFSQMRNIPLSRLWNTQGKAIPQSDYTIGADTVEQMLEKIKAHPWPIYKIKIRSPHDIDALIKIRAATNSTLRIDANEALQYEDCVKLLPEWEKLQLDLIEQPLNKEDWEAAAALKAQSKIPIYADESCVEEHDVLKCAKAFHGINIKLTKCGGITPALRMISEARQLGLKIMLGSMNESSIGTAAMVQLAPLVDTLDADGPLLLKQDIAEGLTYDNAQPQVRPYPGLGVRFLGKAYDSNHFKM